MKNRDCAEELCDLIREGTSPFHAVSVAEKRLREQGFESLSMKRPWQLEKGGRYYVSVRESTLIAFTIGDGWSEQEGFRIAAAHTDFPGLRVKQHAEMVRGNYGQLNVEVYGGAILNTWLDRPLSASGRVALKSDDVFRPQTRLVDLKKPYFIIPNLAIHLNREVNKGTELNRQKEMLPIAVVGKEQLTDDFFRKLLAQELEVEPDEILDYEMGLYNADQPQYVGIGEDLLSAPRIDNLSGVQAILTGITEGSRDGINVAAFFDHEEIGSRTKQGAGSTLLTMVLEKLFQGLGMDRLEYLQQMPESMLLSVDVGHAYHPNYGDKMDPTNQSPLNTGFCIKEASSQFYATDCRAVAIVEQICRQEEIPYTKFFNRSDGTGGSTLGSIASSFLPIPTVDVGVPLLAMHSSRELMGVKDIRALADMIRAYYTL